jgi:dethiobiotin synthetase
MQDASLTTRPGGFFITGTDTEIGKSFVASCIAQGLVQQGIRVAPRKPVASGCIMQADGSLLSEDAMQLKQASQSDEPLAQICRYQFEPAISPARAIQQSQCMISIQDLVQASEVNAGDFALVEGAGGFYSPLASDGLNADLAQQLNYPIILVVGNRLGCLNHALLTIEAIERRGLQLHRIVLNDLCKEADPDNLNDLKQLTDYPVVHQAFQAEISPLNL